jgi:GTPase
MKEYTAQIQQQFHFMSWVPMVFTSAKFGQRVNKVLDMALQVADERRKRVPTGQLNKLVREAVAEHAPPSKPGKWLKILYATQADIDPPTFIFSVNDADAVHFSYERYLENKLRSTFGFQGTPIRLFFRGRESDK